MEISEDNPQFHISPETKHGLSDVTLRGDHWGSFLHPRCEDNVPTAQAWLKLCHATGQWSQSHQQIYNRATQLNFNPIKMLWWDLKKAVHKLIHAHLNKPKQHWGVPPQQWRWHWYSHLKNNYFLSTLLKVVCKCWTWYLLFHMFLIWKQIRGICIKRIKLTPFACVVSGMISAGKILNMSYLLSSHLFTYEKKQGGDSCYTYL